MRTLLACTGLILLTAATSYATTASPPTVPDVHGKPMPAAVKALVAAGYYADTAPVTSGAARGTVTKQLPRAGVRLARGKPVRLAVSIGPTKAPLLPTVRIPKVIGQTAAAARVKLVTSKLTMATKFRKVGAAKRGKVIAQNPLGGVFRQYATVTILVGK